MPADPAEGTTLYSVDLDSGAATAIGSVGSGVQLVGLAIAPDVGNVYGLTDAGELATFSVDDLTAVTTAAITGLEATIRWSASPPSGRRQRRRFDWWWSRLHDRPGNGAATAVGEAIDPALKSAAFGFDFNPTVDRIRRCQHGAKPPPQPRHRVDRHEPRHRRTDDRRQARFAEGDPNAGESPRRSARRTPTGCRRHPDVALRRRRHHRLAGDPDAAERRDPQHRRLARCRCSRHHLFNIAANGDALLAVPSGAFGAATDAAATLTSGPGCAAVPTDGEGSFEGMADDPPPPRRATTRSCRRWRRRYRRPASSTRSTAKARSRSSPRPTRRSARSRPRTSRRSSLIRPVLSPTS